MYYYNTLYTKSDNVRTSRYTYNHAGDRIVKSHGDLEGVYINGAPQGITFHEHDEFTLYPASIISVNKNRFTKHYFIGDKRIASRIGSGQFNNVYGRNGCYVTAGQQDYAERINQIEQQREEYYKELGIPPGVPTMKGAYGDPENTGVGYNTIITELGDHSVPKNWEQYIIKKGKGETPGPPIIWGEPQSPEEVEPGYGYIADDAIVEETFFYHSDHLGSTSYITDQDGNITQYTAYLPYGELLVDEHSSSEELPYKFNGKELDEETGLYYYGARYMQPVASIWYGVDPLMEKYPNLSAYNYCAGNPVNLLDTDGRKIVLTGSRKERMTMLRYLQRLTNDNLFVNRKTGEVTIGGKRWDNRNKKLNVGTALLRDIVNNKHTMYVKVISNGEGNSERDVKPNDALNGIGTDVLVKFDVSSNIKTPTLDDKSQRVVYKERPHEIGLGHELVHGIRSMEGKAVDYKIKADYQYFNSKGQKIKVRESLEELETVGLRGTYRYSENKLRIEHKLGKRGAY